VIKLFTQDGIKISIINKIVVPLNHYIKENLDVLNLNFNITNGLYDARIVGSRESANIGAGKSEITGEISVMFEDLTYFNKWLNETETSIKLTYTNGTSTCEFNFPRVKYSGPGSREIESQEGVVLNLKFRALVDSTEGSDVVITLINDEATV
jgi:hypothetical protein